jgi:uracil-xanthine permease
MAIGWKVVHEGRTPPPGEAVAPDERLSWGRTVGLGAQHVIAMFGATFVFPLIMGLDPNLAIMMSGIATICFLLIVGGQVPSYLGTSASFVGGAAAIYAQEGGPADVTGAILIAGLVLAIVGVIVHYSGAGSVNAVLPPVVTGAVVMLIGLNLAVVASGTGPTTTGLYWASDHWVALITMAITIVTAVAFRGFIGRIAILVGLIGGCVIAWLFDVIGGPHDFPGVNGGKPLTADRINFDAVKDASWFGLPDHTQDGLVGNQFEAGNLDAVGWHWPSFSITFTLLVLPAVIALVAENIGHVKAVGEMTERDLDPVIGRALLGDGVGTMLTSSVGGSPTTTYAENIGVMAATRVYSTAAYYVAGIVAILLGLIPKVGAVINAVPSAVLGGVTVVLYGMIGLLGAKIWKENQVDFADPVNLVPIGAGVTIGIGGANLQITDDFSIQGIALGTLVVVLGWHLARAIADRRGTGGAEFVAVHPGLHPSDEAREEERLDERR